MRRLLALILLVVSLAVHAGEQYMIHHYSIEDGLSQNNVMDILQDRQGYMWFGTWNGLNRFDGYEFQVYKAMRDGQEARVNNRVELIYEDEQEQLWWKTYDDHYYMLDRSRSQMESKTKDQLPKGMQGKLAQKNEVMRVDRHGISWQVDDQPGIMRCKNGEWKRLTVEVDKRFVGQQREYFLMLEDSLGRTWVNPNGGGWSYYDADQDRLVSPFAELSNVIHAAYIDRDGQMWLSTFNGGVECINMDVRPYKLYDVRKSPSDAGEVRAFVQLKNGEVRTFVKAQEMAYCALDSRYGLLCGYKGKGLVNLSTGASIKTSNRDIYDIVEGEDGTLYVGTYGSGVNIIKYDSAKGQFGDPRIVGNKLKVRDLLLQDSVLWCGTTTGLARVDLRDYSIRMVEGHDVRALCLSHGKLWLGTFGGGLSMLDPEDPELKIKHINTYSDIVLSLVSVGDGLWFTSERDIRQYSVTNQSLHYYDALSTERGTYFTEAEPLLTDDGLIYFGYSRGYCVLDTKQVSFNKKIPPVRITHCISAGMEQKGDTIYLDNRADLTIEYAALDYINAQNILYVYRMDGVDKDWQPATHQRRTTFSNLKYGEYAFHVYSQNHEGGVSPNGTTLYIIVRKPLWLSWWAILLYILAFFGVVGLTIYIMSSYQQLRQKVQIEQQVTDIKLRFFTNISHELRTPLTLISGPVDNILTTERISPSVRSQLEIVRSNSQRMLRMVNQLLDFRKIQNKKMRLKVQKTLLADLVAETCKNFQKEAADKHINFLQTYTAIDSTAWVDRSRIDTIVYNLLSNAFKFTAAGKTIEVSVAEKPGYLLLIVRDEGIGIPMEKRSYLFERFSSNNELNTGNMGGTGIGLNLVKELVDLHHGHIEVESEVGKGTTFTVMLHTGNEHYDDDVEIIVDDTTIAQTTTEKQAHPLEITSNKKNLRKILVVDDNEDMRNFLSGILSNDYAVSTADNGIQAWSQICQEAPDLIITDLMMPKMDGLELTQRVKESSDTNYIPLILLTAKSAIESRLQAMEYGADDYVTKPFEPEYLRARVQNIISQREQLEARYRERLLRLEPQENDEQLSGDTFLAKLLNIMDREMDNNELTVEQLVEDMNMGRTVFFNKLKGMTGLSPVEFIREIRIKRAAQLLESDEYNITEVTYMVGMNDSRYFSKCFKNTYGMTPSEYKRSRRIEE